MKKKKPMTLCCGELVLPSLMKALAIYFVIFGVRSHLTYSGWFAWEPLLLYFVGAMFFMWGKHLAMQCRI
jgi:hypothetical protein